MKIQDPEDGRIIQEHQKHQLTFFSHCLFSAMQDLRLLQSTSNSNNFPLMLSPPFSFLPPQIFHLLTPLGNHDEFPPGNFRLSVRQSLFFLFLLMALPPHPLRLLTRSNNLSLFLCLYPGSSLWQHNSISDRTV